MHNWQTLSIKALCSEQHTAHHKAADGLPLHTSPPPEMRLNDSVRRLRSWSPLVQRVWRVGREGAQRVWRCGGKVSCWGRVGDSDAEGSG